MGMRKIITPKQWQGYNSPPNRTRFAKPKRRNWQIRQIISVLIFITVLGLLGAGVGGSFFIWYFSRGLLAPREISSRAISQSTKIYDRTDRELLFDIHGEIKRTAIKLSDISPHVKNAAIAAEDKNFYKHSGFDWRGILRALFINVVRGGRLQGGSTITQQFIKNAVLSPEKTYTRKFKELAMAYRLEKSFSKDQILEMYFNEIPYGSVSYGVEAAAQSFFGKGASDLYLAEAALLAALPKAPTYYSPYGSHREELLARQHYILNTMVEGEFITPEAAEDAKKIDILAEIKPKREKIIAPHFVMYIKELLAEKYGERAVESGGLRVTTTLDLEKQAIAEQAVADNKKLINSFGASNAALVSLDVKTGQILAMVGSVDYFDNKIDGQVNVTLRPRQPGSSFKPIVYAAAFIKGYTPTTMLYDAVTIFKTEIGKDYEPHNYDDKEHGPVTVRQALAGSLNIPAVKMIYLTGVNKVLDLAEKLGYTTLGDRSRFGLSLVLGGGEVKLLEHVGVFAAFAREGRSLPPTTILRVENANGNVLEEFGGAAGEGAVFDPEIARQINSILSDNEARTFVFGAQNFLTLLDRPVAAKTGTTNDYRDAWTIGFTPSLATGVWVGNNNNAEMRRSADGSRVAAPIWNQYMKTALKDTPVETFTEPQPIITGKPVLDGQSGAGTTVKIDKISGKLATEATPPQTIIERAFKQAHNILYYVNKDDPRGVTPADPSTDIQFENWETAVRRWATGQNITDEVPPTEYDDLHKIEDKPKIKIIAPSDNETVVSSSFGVSLDTTSPRGVRRVEFYVDDALVSTVGAPPWNQTIQLPSGVANGFHALRATAFDDLENNSSAEIIFNLLR